MLGMLLPGNAVQPGEKMSSAREFAIQLFPEGWMAEPDIERIATLIEARDSALLRDERAQLEDYKRQLDVWESNEGCPECGEIHICSTQRELRDARADLARERARCHAQTDGDCNWVECPQLREKVKEWVEYYAALDRWYENKGARYDRPSSPSSIAISDDLARERARVKELEFQRMEHDPEWCDLQLKQERARLNEVRKQEAQWWQQSIDDSEHASLETRIKIVNERMERLAT